MSHISLADEHCEILENSSEFKANVIIFLAIQSNLTFLFSASVHWDQGFSIKDPSFSNLGIKGSLLGLLVFKFKRGGVN